MKILVHTACILKCLQDYTKFTKDFGNVSVPDTPTFFFGMKRGEEIQVNYRKGKTLIIKMNGVSDPDEDGNRIVSLNSMVNHVLLKFMINMLRQLALFVVK